MAQCAIQTCEICDKASGKFYCKNCEQYFCSDCKVSHLKSKVSKNHVFDKSENVNPEEKIPKCEFHNEVFTYFCETCNCLLCAICLPENHKKHDFCLIDEAAAKSKKKVQSMLTKAEANIKQASDDISDLKTKVKQFRESNKKIIENIELKRKEIIDSVNRKTEKLIKEVNDHEAVECKLFEETIKKKMGDLANVQDVVVNARKLNAKSNNVILLNLAADLRRRLESYKLSVKDSIKEIAQIQFIKPSAGIQDIEDAVGSLNICGKLCTVENIKIGDRVRVKSSVVEPTEKWGRINHSSIGVVRNVFDTKVSIDFPEHNDWQGLVSELEFA